MSAFSAFLSECPKCKQDRHQSGYGCEELIQLLDAGAEIEAYCISCDEHWSLSTEERADIARALVREASGPAARPIASAKKK